MGNISKGKNQKTSLWGNVSVFSITVPTHLSLGHAWGLFCSQFFRLKSLRSDSPISMNPVMASWWMTDNIVGTYVKKVTWWEREPERERQRNWESGFFLCDNSLFPSVTKVPWEPSWSSQEQCPLWPNYLPWGYTPYRFHCSALSHPAEHVNR